MTIPTFPIPIRSGYHIPCVIKPRVSLHHTCICVTFTSSSLDPYSAIRRRNTNDSSPLLIVLMLTSCGPLYSFLSVTVCKNTTSSRTSVRTDGVGTDGSLLCSSGITSRLSCYGEPFLHMLVQNKAILSWCGDSRTTTARAIVGAVGAVISMLKTVDKSL